MFFRSLFSMYIYMFHTYIPISFFNLLFFSSRYCSVIEFSSVSGVSVRVSVSIRVSVSVSVSARVRVSASARVWG